MRQVEFVLDGEADVAAFEAVDGVRNVMVEGNHVEMSFGGDMGDLLTMATERYGVDDIKTSEADLEEIFLTYYHGGEEEMEVPG